MQKNIRKLISIGLTAAALTVSTLASAATDLSGKSWAEIEELAKKEGKVTVSVWYLQPQFRNFVISSKHLKANTALKSKCRKARWTAILIN